MNPDEGETSLAADYLNFEAGTDKKIIITISKTSTLYYYRNQHYMKQTKVIDSIVALYFAEIL